MVTALTTNALAEYGGWGPHAGGPPFLFGALMLLLLVALVGLVTWLAVRGGRGRAQTGTDRARDLLADRYARGEISTDEYHERLNHLS
ncbi:SHOCT domain-containing protein [Parasphingorhabdus pacifica]